MTFKPNETQLRHLAERRNTRRGRILKYRQGGITTLYCIDDLDDALWTGGFAAAIIAHERQLVDQIFQIIKRAYEGLPEDLKPETRQDTLHNYRFKRMSPKLGGAVLDSEIYVAMKLRGYTVQSLHIAERAFITGERARELEDGSKEAVPMQGRITEETTANGYGPWRSAFMHDWTNQSPGPMDYHAFFYAWHEHSEYSLPGTIEEYTAEDLQLKQIVAEAYDGKQLTDGQVLWYRWKLNQKRTGKTEELGGLTPEQSMKQEYPSTVNEAFQSGLGNVFNVEKLAGMSKQNPLRVLENGALIFKEPIKRGDKVIGDNGEVERDEDGREVRHLKDRQYVLGADPSGGDADDETSIDILDVETKEQVAHWSGLLRPDEAADLAYELSKMYNNAFAGIENNQLSMVMFYAKLTDNYYFTTKMDEKRNRRTKKIGWNTNTATRDLMIDEFRMHFDEDTVIINAGKTIDQMMTFVKKDNGKREHADGEHDDAVISIMIALQMTKFVKQQGGAKRRSFAKPRSL